jgi:hypothetical protein
VLAKAKPRFPCGRDRVSSPYKMLKMLKMWGKGVT